MPLLREPTTTSKATGAATSTGSGTVGNAVPGQRRGARVRARVSGPRLRRAARIARDAEAARLPDPLLTAPMAIEQGPVADLVGNLATKASRASAMPAAGPGSAPDQAVLPPT